jgi:hypothetical protein
MSGLLLNIPTRNSYIAICDVRQGLNLPHFHRFVGARWIGCLEKGNAPGFAGGVTISHFIVES